MKSTSEPSFDDRFDNNLPDYVNLTPVDYDPFSRAAQRIRAHYEEANQRTSGLPQVLDYYGNKIKSALTAPQDAFTGQMQVSDPETGMPTQEAMGRAGEVAGLTGIGNPFAVKGALGSAGGRLMQMENKAPPFYSALEHAVENTKQQKMPADQWLGTISNSKGVKPEELDWTGFKDFLAEKGKEPVTKAEVQEHLNNNKVELKEVRKGKSEKDEVLTPNDSGFDPSRIQTTAATKYSQYQLPGGENYREMLMTMPNKSNQWKKINENEWHADDGYKIVKEGDNQYITINPQGKRVSANDTLEQSQFVRNSSRENAANPSAYRSSHWDEPNILAHVRMNDRNIEGKKSLHLEEIQSDWHQQGRERGYKTELKNIPLTAVKKDGYYEVNGPNGRFISNIIGDHTEQSAIAEARNRIANNQSNRIGDQGVPDAPFKKSWHELVLKRMIREAAEKGYDRLSWTPGEAQAARYDLSKQVDEIHYNKNSQTLKVMKNGNPIINKIIDPKELPATIGKEAAEKIINNPTEKSGNAWHILKGEGLRVGGEGMKGFYDQIIPKAIEKIGKEHGVKVKTAETETNPKGWKITPPSETVSGKWMVKSNDYNSKGFHFNTKEEAEANLKQQIEGERTPKQKLHYIDIPESLKNVATQKGFPLFSSGLPFSFTPIDGDPFEKKK